ncbi:DUF2637 domain-containing protein [Streptomyces sp. H27-S2]|uniref:DUF2637 domain-containing protein n=1 Tax=Streptomyces antarcticus TaxID=2996458 RepID=UPI00226E2150|nr:DUF2637 domain-containing protein [Streptomyces sp. H27-S2]MCY0955055.1 DUF2637 domain-containing protein [Streptomyces sp. H27-S2]
MELTRTHRILIGIVVAGAVVIAGIGFAGSYSAVRTLALQKGFGSFSLVFPIGIDAGICVLLALDLLLTWMRIPFPLLRQTAWLLTAATIAFNGAASWPDPLGVGMHAVIPILFVVTVEAARHAVGRIADITADRHMEGVRITRWVLSPIPTFKLWRRMKLWELRSYEQAVGMEQDRLIYQARLQARYGRAWRRKAPVAALMPLRLARIGVPLAHTAPEGLAAAGIDPALVGPMAPAAQHGVVERADMPLATSVDPAILKPKSVAGQTSAVGGVEDARSAVSPRGGMWQDVAPEDTFEAHRSFASATGALPDAVTFPQHLADAHKARNPETGELMPTAVVEQLLHPITAGLTVAVDQVIGGLTDSSVANGQAVRPVAEPASATPHPPFAHRPLPAPEPVPGRGPAPVLHPSSSAPAVSAGSADTPPRQQGRHTAGPPQSPLWGAPVTATEPGTAGLPEQQTDDNELTENDRQIQLVVGWLETAEAAGEKLAGAEVARRLEIPARTGLRRLKSAIKYREEHQRKAVRAHLRSVSTSS